MNESEPRQQAEKGDAEACNRLGAMLLKNAFKLYLPYLSPSTDRMYLENEFQRANQAANDIFDHYRYGEDNPSILEHAEAEVSQWQLLLRAHDEGPEVLEERRALRARSFKEAFAFFERAAALGDPEGMWNCGWRCYKGEGVAKDTAKAIEYWGTAAAHGHQPALAKITELALQAVG